MNLIRGHCAILVFSCLCLCFAGVSVFAASTVNVTNRHAWGANIGWQNWRADGTNGVVFGEYVCAGYIYAANVGWIHLGDGTPADGIQYQNNSAVDYGVNHMGDGRLRGMAYGANIGWVSFEDTGDPRVNLLTGEFSGYAYGANVGWINLNTAQGFVETDSMTPGLDSDGDGIPDAWEIINFGGPTNAHPVAIASNEVNTLLEAYLADLDPSDPSDYLEFTNIEHAGGPPQKEITWASKETRLYRLHGSTNLVEDAWANVDPPGLTAPDPGASTTRSVPDDPVDHRAFRVTPVLPLP